MGTRTRYVLRSWTPSNGYSIGFDYSVRNLRSPGSHGLTRTPAPRGPSLGTPQSLHLGTPPVRGPLPPHTPLCVPVRTPPSHPPAPSSPLFSRVPICVVAPRSPTGGGSCASGRGPSSWCHPTLLGVPTLRGSLHWVGGAKGSPKGGPRISRYFVHPTTRRGFGYEGAEPWRAFGVP